MRFYVCEVCKNAWQVGGDPKELQHLYGYLQNPSCPTPLCQGKLHNVGEALPHYAVKEIPLPTFFRAVNGFGSAVGEAASLEKFKELLTTKKIIEIHAVPVGQPERVILQRLVLEDGTRLHFDTSSRGACCYYIEQVGPSCVEVLGEQSNLGNSKTVA